MANTKRTWIALSPHQERIEITDLRAFCKENRFNYSAMYRALSDPEHQATSRGYRAHPDQQNETRAKSTKKYALFNEGLEKSTSFTAHRPTLVEQSGISNQSVWRLISGQAVQVRGWRITDDVDEIPLFAADFETQIPVNDIPSDIVVTDEIELLPGEEDI